MPKHRDRARHKGRREGGSYAPWPHACARHANYYRLGFPAKALLGEFLGQFNGYNNGDLTCSFTVLKARGWRSRTTVERACRELEQSGWIVRTRQGFRNRCNLYALTFFAIDECRGKLDVPAGRIPLGFWKEGRNAWLERDLPTRPPANSFALARRWATRGQEMVKSEENGHSDAHCGDQLVPKSDADEHEQLPSN